MDIKILDTAIESPITDIIEYKKMVLVASYDKYIRVYRKLELIHSIIIPEPIHKMTIHANYIILGAISGNIFIMDSQYRIIDTIKTIPNISCIASYAEGVLIGSWNTLVAILKPKQHQQTYLSENKENKQETTVSDSMNDSYLNNRQTYTNENKAQANENPNYVVDCIRTTKKAVSAISVQGDRFAIACENFVGIYDLEFNKIFHKEVDFNINSLLLRTEDLIIGLINGKIYREDLLDKNMSFAFNAHVEMKPNERIYHSVNQLIFGDHLYSAGSDGKIIKWDIERKKQLNTKYEGPNSIKKFIMTQDGMYIIVDDILDKDDVNKLFYIDFEELK